MRGLPVAAVVALLASACYREYAPASTTPDFRPEPIVVQGPPGGVIDPGYGFEAEAYGAAAIEPSSDPQDPGYVLGTVTDAEIDATLQPYGEWVEDPEYGRVWRPHTTVVGVDFTPYETCGTWVWTDYGWTYGCDWDWGWLPFHYGQWAWCDGYWGWVADYTWSPAWVEWRHGSGYVGWRPARPHQRDHRAGSRGPRIRDHRSGASDWRFTTERDFGRRIRGRTLANPSEGLRVTTTVARPPVRATVWPIRAAGLMRARLDARGGRTWAPTTANPPSVRPTFDRPVRDAYGRPTSETTRPTYDRPTRPTYDRPIHDRPTRPTFDRPAYDRPTRPSYDRPSSPPSRPSHDRPSSPPSRPSYDRPSSPPSRPSSPPSRPSYDRPSSPPSRPSYDRPSSSSSSSSSSRGHSSSSAPASSRRHR